jgi:phosphoribosylcarboxyaminoimidazole (NCAIR) mutase
MAKQIWKYSLENVIEMPKGAEILTIDIQNGQMFNAQMWVKVNTENEMEKRMFEVIGTGQNFDDTNKKYVGTYQDGPFVWHVFEKDLDN